MSPETDENLARVDETLRRLSDRINFYRALREHLVAGCDWQEAERRAEEDPHPKGERRRTGRPPRAEVHSALIDKAPFPELVTMRADHLPQWLSYNPQTPAVLRAAHRFEVEHGRRRSVIRLLAERLRGQGEPVGGPLGEPMPGYSVLDPAAAVRMLAETRDAQLAADVYAWEWYRDRRPQVLRAAEQIAGKQAARRRVRETEPAQLPELPEPWEGYDALVASPAGRDAVRAALNGRSQEELTAAVAYEEATRNRAIILRALRRALHVRVVETDDEMGRRNSRLAS